MSWPSVATRVIAAATGWLICLTPNVLIQATSTNDEIIAAELRALEIEAQVILKATNVDGIYTNDPKMDPKATLLRQVTYQDAIVKNYAVMDANAFGLCKANQLPIVVFNINQPGAIKRVLEGDPDVGTIVR